MTDSYFNSLKINFIILFSISINKFSCLWTTRARLGKQLWIVWGCSLSKQDEFEHKFENCLLNELSLNSV